MPAGWITAAAAVYGAVSSSNAADDANQTQQNASNNQVALQREQMARQDAQYKDTRADYQPYRDAGVRSLGLLEGEINKPVTSADVMQDPGYEFGRAQGQLALDRKAAAMGGRVSGTALKGAAEYATNYATTGYNAAYQRRQDRLNRLASLAGVGQSATGASAGAGAANSAAGANSINAISGILGSQGDATAARQLAQGNIWGNAANQLGAAGQRWISDNNSAGGTGYLGTGNYSTSQFGSDGTVYHPSDNYG